MKEYQHLTTEQIEILKAHDCWAENWDNVLVTPDFDCKRIHRVQFYGWARLGNGQGTVEITEGFVKNCGIYNATLRNVTIGDNCLIENIGNYLNNVTVGNGCYISNVSTIDTQGKPNYGQGHTISVLNEVGDGNLLLLNELNSQLAALMVKHGDNKQLMEAMKKPDGTYRTYDEMVSENIPVKYIGVGEGIDDLMPFNAREFVEALI